MTTSTYVSDRVLLRFITDSPHEIIVTAIGEDYTFYGLESNTISWNPNNNPGILNSVIYAKSSTTAPFALQITVDEQSITLYPAKVEYWQTWTGTSIPGLEFMWVGGKNFPCKSNLGRSIARKEGFWEKNVIPLTDDFDYYFKIYD
jgi:hypothetical protein